MICKRCYISTLLGFPSHLLEPFCPCLEGNASGPRPGWPLASRHTGQRRTRRPWPSFRLVPLGSGLVMRFFPHASDLVSVVDVVAIAAIAALFVTHTSGQEMPNPVAAW